MNPRDKAGLAYRDLQHTISKLWSMDAVEIMEGLVTELQDKIADYVDAELEAHSTYPVPQEESLSPIKDCAMKLYNEVYDVIKKLLP